MANMNENSAEKSNKNSIIDENQIAAEAKKFLRIGGKWYKKAIDPVTKQEALFDVSASMLIADNGKEIGNMILKMAPKYLAKTNIPSHIDYKEGIDNGDGELFYNIYRPIKYSPKEGQWEYIERLFRQIFREQYEMGLDYAQIMYLNPLHKLPILLLVSSETGTGKSKFCQFLNEVFGQNALPITPEIIESRFNSFWVGKLIGYVEEQADDPKDRHQQNAKVKNVVTAETLPSESKGKDPTLARNFMKLILCSNDEYTPVKIDKNDSRYWVRKVLPLTDKEKEISILDECVKEIPAFLYFLLHRKMHTERKNRLWFSPEEIQTDAWRRIVECGKSSFETSLVNLLIDTMNAYDLDELKYSKTELNLIVRNASQFSDKDRRQTSDIKIRNILRGWGLHATKNTVRHDVYSLDYGGGPKALPENRSSNVFVVTRDLLQSLTKQS